MRHRLWLVPFVALTLTACGKPKPTVVLDGWWSVDYAKTACTQANQWHHDNASLISQIGCSAVTACPEMMPRVEACRSDPAPEVLGFETELATELATDSGCSGVRFATFEGPSKGDRTVSDLMQGPHWSLFLDFEPGARKQSWDMSRSPGLKAFTKGVGNPKEIAATVCAVLRERGAELLN